MVSSLSRVRSDPRAPLLFFAMALAMALAMAGAIGGARWRSPPPLS